MEQQVIDQEPSVASRVSRIAVTLFPRWGIANRASPSFDTDLVTETRSRGLSLGDRACLALAITLQAPVYATDRIWESVNVGIDVRVLR
jgi:PIN domain nuclease of toxin-antitoxin system